MCETDDADVRMAHHRSALIVYLLLTLSDDSIVVDTTAYTSTVTHVHVPVGHNMHAISLKIRRHYTHR